MELTKNDQRKAARMLRRIADHASESLHFSSRAAGAKTEDARLHWWDRATHHSDRHMQEVHALADLLDVDIETRKARA